MRVFEAAARHNSFTGAAEELRVTQAAVSRQVAVLEAYLGFKLFKRLNREVQLTDIGIRYAQKVTRAFDIIESATDELPVVRPSLRQLNVRVYSTFAQYWLIPRLSTFYAKHPNIQVNIHTSLDEVDFEKDDVHVWLHYGTVRQSNVTVEPFLGDTIQPACSPDFAKKLSKPPKVADIADLPMLQTLHRGRDWQAWLRFAGHPRLKSNKVRIFENSALAYQAAMDGLGIVIAQMAFIERYVAAGQLVTPFNLPLDRPHNYQLVYRSAGRGMPALEAFRDWLLNQGALK